ncbi:DUF3786 domain-containing protein [Thermodesulfobacteriota bacterium]
MSQEGLKKIAAQQRILGAPCPILECAIDKRLDYCTRDCDGFPCARFKNVPYPFSHGFLNMQERRRKESPPLKSPSGYDVDVPVQHWEDLKDKDTEIICRNALTKNDPPHGILLPFLKEHLLVDVERRCINQMTRNGWKQVNNPLLELVCLVYLLHAGPESLDHNMIGVNELKTAHFFRGPHELKIQPLLDRYGNDLDGFKRAAKSIKGEIIEMADVAYAFKVFPKVPLYYLFWKGDEEFEPRLSILFDRSIEHHLAADTIWGLVTLVSNILLLDGRWHYG